LNLRNGILLGTLAVQAILLIVVFWPEAAASEPVQLFDGLERDDIIQVILSDSTGRRIELARGPDGCTLPDADGYPCKLDEMLSLMDKLAALSTENLVTQTAASHRRLGVADDEFERLIEFGLSDGTSHRLLLGTSPRLRSIHVRAGSRNEVYLAPGISTSDAGVVAVSWTDTRYLTIPRDDVVAIGLVNAQGVFNLDRDGSGEWAIEGLGDGETVDQGAVNAVLSRVTALSMRRPLGKTELDSYGIGNPGAVVTVETRDAEGNERTYTLWVGSEIEEDEFAAKSSESEYFVVLPGFSAGDLVEKTRDDLVNPPPTPTPPATSTPATSTSATSTSDTP
jgi:hypothetical protein